MWGLKQSCEGDVMNESSKTNQQLLLEIEELRARLAVAQQRLQEANERMQEGYFKQLS